MKTCKTCKVDKDIDEFPKNGAGAYKPHCKVCYNAKQFEYRNQNPEALRHSWNRASKKYYTTESRKEKTIKAYGLTPKEYETMLVSHNGGCWICGRKDRRLVIDHCHKTGRVRGLLCDGCNLTLAHMNDDVEMLQAAILYLGLRHHI